MRKRTELSERPPEYSVVNDGGMARVRFYEGVQEKPRDGENAWTAEMWELSLPWTPDLPERVAARPGLWREKVKDAVRGAEARAALEKLNGTATETAVCELADIVAELVDAVAELAEMVG